MEEAKEITKREMIFFVIFCTILLSILVVKHWNDDQRNTDLTFLACNMSYEALSNESFCTSITNTNNLDECFDKIESRCNIKLRFNISLEKK